MRLLALLKQVPDPAGGLNGLPPARVMNPADESALETALLIRDKGDCEVTVMTMGPMSTESMLKDALSRGADKAVMLTGDAFAGADTLTTAKCLSAAIRALGGFDLILCGRRATDGETGQVGPMTASLLDIPCIYNALSVDVCGGFLEAGQLRESGEARWRARLPALVAMCEWSLKLRLPSIRGMRFAARAGIRVMSPGDIGLACVDCGLSASPTRVVKTGAPLSGARRCEMLSPREALMRLWSGGMPV